MGEALGHKAECLAVVRIEAMVRANTGAHPLKEGRGWWKIGGWIEELVVRLEQIFHHNQDLLDLLLTRFCLLQHLAQAQHFRLLLALIDAQFVQFGRELGHLRLQTHTSV